MNGRIKQCHIIPFGRCGEFRPKHPERTAYKSQPGIFGDIVFRTWPNRASMLKTIEMQGKREHRQTDWADYSTSGWAKRGAP